MRPQKADTVSHGRYELRELIGGGGMAEVYSAWDTTLHTQRAVKILKSDLSLRPEIRARFLDEARVIGEIDHPNIVRVWDAGQEGDQLYIVMELVTGGSLWDWIEREKGLPPRIAVEVCLGVLKGLSVVHDKGIVHRDIKPENILLTAEGHVRVSDFGIARITRPTGGPTQSGVVMGTWCYMPPEQRDSARNVDLRADIYATGALLWASLKGRRPPDLAALDRDATMLEGIPPTLAPILTRATSWRREDRYADTLQMARALDEVRGSLPEVPRDQAFTGSSFPEVRPVAVRSSPPGAQPVRSVEPPAESDSRAGTRTLDSNASTTPTPEPPGSFPWSLAAAVGVALLAAGLWYGYGREPASVVEEDPPVAPQVTAPQVPVVPVVEEKTLPTGPAIATNSSTPTQDRENPSRGSQVEKKSQEAHKEVSSLLDPSSAVEGATLGGAGATTGSRQEEAVAPSPSRTLPVRIVGAVPDGSTVLIDGKEVGRTPGLVVPLLEGNHSFLVVQPDGSTLNGSRRVDTSGPEARLDLSPR